MVMKKTIFIVLVFIVVLISIPIMNGSISTLNAASSYTTGNHVYLGNESYTIIDSNTMTLLADKAVGDGEMTWDNAVSLLSNLPSNYGGLGSKVVTGNLSLPKTSDLSSLMNEDQTALTTISPISSDWWLGDESVDNRSKFVGANTNSLVTDVRIVKNVLDKAEKVCNMDQTVIEQGIKPTRTANDMDLSIHVNRGKFLLRTVGTVKKMELYETPDCSGQFSDMNFNVGGGTSVIMDPNNLDLGQALQNSGYLKIHFMFVNHAIDKMGLIDYLEGYLADPSQGVDKVFSVPVQNEVCQTFSKPLNVENPYGILKDVNSYKVYDDTPDKFIDVQIGFTENPDVINCPGHAQTAGTSSVRPLLTLGKDKLAYSSASKPTFQFSPIINHPIPKVEGGNSYLTLTDSDLEITLDPNHGNVTNNVLKVDLADASSMITIPIALSGNVASGTRYVSAMAHINNQDQYGVLGAINGTTGTVQFDLSSFPDWQTAKTLSLTLYQEVDEGTNTTYRGNGTEITLELNLPDPTVVFTPSTHYFTYKDAYTTANGTVGIFSLDYPEGFQVPQISSIQLATTGDESHFSIDNTGALKVKGNDLDGGTYNVTVSGKDTNDAKFTKSVQIVVGKRNQDNYQITNEANYKFQTNQDITITTFGNESGENETYTITNGNSIAQISNTNKFQMLSAGTFTLEATVQGNQNYNPKTVTKQITLSQLPTQTNPIKISSGDSMIYGNTYTPTSTGGTGSGNVSWVIENDSGTGAILNNGSIKVTGIGTFTLKVTKAGDTNYQSSSDSKVITVNKRKTTVKPKDVTRKVGEAFKDNGVTYNPQPVAGDSLGTPIITSKYPTSQQAGRYTDGIQVTGLTNPNYDFEYQEGTLIINDTTLPNNGSGYYKITGTLGKNNWYISDIQISTINKDGYDEISSDGINFQTTPLIYQTDGEYPITFYLKNSTTGIIAKGINYQVKIDQTPPTVPTLTMNQINTSRMARLINFLSFGNWMNTGAEVVMSSSDGTSGIDNYTYIETDTKGSSNTKTSTTGKVTYQDDVEIGITAKACDKAGNCSDLSASETLMIDRKGPDITGVKDQSVYKYYYLPRFVNVKDSGSGLSYAEYLKDGAQAGTIQENVNERIDGVGKYEVNAIDNAGNESTLSFEIVPLPNIDDIDGSDESKDIIDQVKDEYEEVKDHLTDEERKEYEDWIKDAQDKWESERKKVVETDDKSAKVEGQNGTTFDPNVELIVDDITDQPLPPLPKNANMVYDVYLQKGNMKVEPDGSIKVYLPYTDSEDPIIYQIDENGKVTEIKAEKEGNYVTFITDELGKFAISNTAQPDNKDNMCVVGPDGKVETGDEVCGKPNDKGDQPTKKPDGSVEVPDGGKVEFPNGTEIDTPNGAIINPDGTVTLPDGTEYDPNGNIKDKDVCKLDGKEINIDTDGDGIPDINLDLDGDCTPDINIDNNGDHVPDINIDTTGDGKPNINLDTNGDGKADLNVLLNIKWKPNATFTVHGFTYNTMTGLKPQLNIDDDGDGKPDRNMDADGNGIIDSEENKNMGGVIGNANTSDTTKWNIWWLILVMTFLIMSISIIQNKKHS